MLDFEATCDEPATYPHEIIEVPVVVVDLRTGERDQSRGFHRYVRPIEHPTLSAFCHSLTGIEQWQVAAAADLPTVLGELVAWLRREELDTIGGSAVWMTCGAWDLHKALPKQCARQGIPVPPELSAAGFVNVKRAFAEHYAIRGRQAGMAEMLERAHLPLIGRHHCGLDDARNIASVVSHLCARGVTEWVVERV